MNLIVLGASHGTGAECVKEALARGHQVTAFARTPERLGLTNPKLRPLKGDFLEAASVGSAVAGHDAVIVTAMSSLASFKATPDFFSRGTGHAIAAMKSAGCKRLVILSALGTNDSAPLMPPLMRFLTVGWLIKRPYADHEVQERLVKESGLDWVIARPPRLKDGPARHAYTRTTALTKVPLSITRADVAHFLVEACESPEWVKHSVQLGG